MKALILFTAESITKEQAYPEQLKALLEAHSLEPIEVDVAVYDDLDYYLSAEETQVFVNTTEQPLDTYDIVYLRRIKEATAQAVTVGKYCMAKNIAVIDSEIALRPGSMGKLTQYMQMAIAGLPFPETIYASSHTVLLNAFKRHPLPFPVIVKSVSGSRGSDNHLARSMEELEAVLSADPEVHFLIQAYVPNKSDYRVWVCGDQVGPILYRSRSSGHKNNTSQGGDATLLDDAGILPEDVRKACVRAAQLFNRDVAGVDVVFENDDTEGRFYFFEVNRAPQIEGTPYEDIKARALAGYMAAAARGRK